jgi:O-antigen/teichoic acid export membrane protein
MSFASAPYTRLRLRLAGQFGRFRYGISALDQIALSVFGFGLNLVLVRALAATDYGIVSLWIAVGMLTMSIQNALVGAPLNVHLQGAPDAVSGRRLTEALAVVNLLGIVLITAAVVLVDLFSDAEWAPHDIAAALAIPLFVATGMYRFYYRSLAFSRRDMAMLLSIDGPYLVVTTACLGAMLVWPERFAGLVAAFVAMSVGSLVSRLFLTGRFGAPRAHPFRRDWLRDYRPIVRDAAWALVGVVAAHLQARSYLYVAINMVGLAAMATINVVGVLFRPIRLLVAAWGRAALPELAEHLAGGRIRAVDRIVLRAFAATAAGGAVWSCLLWLGWAPIERFFLVGHYPEAWLLLWPWAVSATLDGMSAILSNALQAAREYKFLAHTSLVAAPITIAATVGAILWGGYTWTMYGVALGYLVVLAMLVARYWLVRRKALATSGSASPSELPAAPPLFRPEA